MDQKETVNSGAGTKPPFFRRVTKHKAFIPIVIFLGVVLIFSFSSQFSEKPPEIHAISPAIAGPGEILVIEGDYFGDVRKGGEVSIAGIRPISSSYYEWKDHRISVQIPSDVNSGVVQVTTHTGKSNSVLFTNKDDIPIVLEGPSKPGHPYIETVSPDTGSVGDPVIIRGLNFGNDRGEGQVYFSAIRSPGETTDEYGFSEEEVNYITARECDFDYKYWSENEIQLFVPDGATSGNFYIETDKGTSNPVYFEVTEPVGTKRLGMKRGYQAQYGVTVRNVSAGSDNWIYIWLPKVLRTVNQNNMENINTPAPYWDYSTQLFVYNFENMQPEQMYQISQSFWFDTYGIETKVDHQQVLHTYEPRKLIEEYTRETGDFPISDPNIVKTVKEIVKWETNPFIKAYLIYVYLMDTTEFSEFIPSNSAVEALEYHKADAYVFSLLYATMLRSAGVPARVISGFLVYGDKKTKAHYWNEFYLEDFGWLPVDPALAAGAEYDDFQFTEDPRTFYFGNIDNQHIITARSGGSPIQIKPDGRTVRKEDIFPLQSIHEEVSPSVRSYSSIWQKMRIIEWW